MSQGPRNPRSAVLALLLVVCMAGCSSGTMKGYVSVEAIGPSVGIMADRHDGYVAADTSLSDVERRTALRTSQILRTVIEEARKE